MQQAIEKLPDESQVVVHAISAFYEHHYELRIQKLEARIKELEDQLSKNCRNSSKPPSSDEFDMPWPKSRREKTGHNRTNLEMVASRDVEQINKVEVCAGCRKSLQRQKSDSIKRW